MKVFLYLANNVITLGHTNDVCTALDELFYYFIVIQVVPSLVNCHGSGRRVNMIFTFHIACSSLSI